MGLVNSTPVLAVVTASSCAAVSTPDALLAVPQTRLDRVIGWPSWSGLMRRRTLMRTVSDCPLSSDTAPSSNFSAGSVGTLARGLARPARSHAARPVYPPPTAGRSTPPRLTGAPISSQEATGPVARSIPKVQLRLSISCTWVAGALPSLLILKV